MGSLSLGLTTAYKKKGYFIVYNKYYDDTTTLVPRILLLELDFNKTTQKDIINKHLFLFIHFINYSYNGSYGTKLLMITSK